MSSSPLTESQDVLDYNKLDSNKDTLESIPFDLCVCIDTGLQLAYNPAQHAHLQVGSITHVAFNYHYLLFFPITFASYNYYLPLLPNTHSSFLSCVLPSVLPSFFSGGVRPRPCAADAAGG
jgi:hypothetical protein